MQCIGQTTTLSPIYNPAIHASANGATLTFITAYSHPLANIPQATVA